MSPLRAHVLPILGHRRISDIHQNDIKKALSKVWRSKPPTASKAIMRLSIIFRQAQLMGLNVDPFTAEAAKHMLGDVRHQVTPVAATPWQQIPELYRRLDGNSAATMAIRFQILTAVRSAPGAHAEMVKLRDRR